MSVHAGVCESSVVVFVSCVFVRLDGSGSEEDAAEKKRQRHEHRFDLERFLLEFANPNVFRVYVTVMASYAVNAPATNQHVVSFFMQVVAPYALDFFR
jgi:hypothetical protein